MKNKVMVFAMAAVAMLAVSCQKDRVDGMTLLTEGFNGNNTKVLVNDTASTWATGDEVRINDQVATVSVTSSAASVHLNEGVTAPFYGSIYRSNDGASYTLNLPATYTYATNGTYQVLGSPMVGYTTDESTMVFKHLTAAITVQVVNYCGFTIQVDSIIVSSNNYKLNGELNVTIGAGNPTVTAATTSDADAKKVTMLFNGSSSLQVFAGDSANVQVPVLPVGVENKFTVRVVTHKVDQPAVKPIFEKEQGSKHALARAYLGYARTTFGGLFSVSASKKVIISQGNLQYIGSAATPYWKFAETQYGFLGDNGQTTSGENKDRDLFCWGTSGWNNGNYLYQPYNLPAGYVEAKGYGFGPTDGSEYDYDLTGTYANSDWGVYNAIQNGGNVSGRWYTMSGNTGGEWDYLFNTRSVAYKYVQATVNSITGVIVLPDDYTHPAEIDDFAQLNKSNNYWSSNVYTVEQWVKLEAAGAVFIPRAGYRSGTGSTYTADDAYYWTTTHFSGTKPINAYVFRMGPYSNSASLTGAKRNSYPVRLVRTVN